MYLLFIYKKSSKSKGKIKSHFWVKKVFNLEKTEMARKSQQSQEGRKMDLLELNISKHARIINQQRGS